MSVKYLFTTCPAATQGLHWPSTPKTRAVVNQKWHFWSVTFKTAPVILATPAHYLRTTKKIYLDLNFIPKNKINFRYIKELNVRDKSKSRERCRWITTWLPGREGLSKHPNSYRNNKGKDWQSWTMIRSSPNQPPHDQFHRFTHSPIHHLPRPPAPVNPCRNLKNAYSTVTAQG